MAPPAQQKGTAGALFAEGTAKWAYFILKLAPFDKISGQIHSIGGDTVSFGFDSLLIDGKELASHCQADGNALISVALIKAKLQSMACPTIKDCTVIKAAYRELALVHHPDRHTRGTPTSPTDLGGCSSSPLNSLASSPNSPTAAARDQLQHQRFQQLHTAYELAMLLAATEEQKEIDTQIAVERAGDKMAAFEDRLERSLKAQRDTAIHEWKMKRERDDRRASSVTMLRRTTSLRSSSSRRGSFGPSDLAEILTQAGVGAFSSSSYKIDSVAQGDSSPIRRDVNNSVDQSSRNGSTSPNGGRPKVSKKGPHSPFDSSDGYTTRHSRFSVPPPPKLNTGSSNKITNAVGSESSPARGGSGTYVGTSLVSGSPMVGHPNELDSQDMSEVRDAGLRTGKPCDHPQHGDIRGISRRGTASPSLGFRKTTIGMGEQPQKVSFASLIFSPSRSDASLPSPSSPPRSNKLPHVNAGSRGIPPPPRQFSPVQVRHPSNETSPTNVKMAEDDPDVLLSATTGVTTAESTSAIEGRVGSSANEVRPLPHPKAKSVSAQQLPQAAARPSSTSTNGAKPSLTVAPRRYSSAVPLMMAPPIPASTTSAAFCSSGSSTSHLLSASASVSPSSVSGSILLPPGTSFSRITSSRWALAPAHHSTGQTTSTSTSTVHSETRQIPASESNQPILADEAAKNALKLEIIKKIVPNSVADMLSIFQQEMAARLDITRMQHSDWLRDFARNLVLLVEAVDEPNDRRFVETAEEESRAIILFLVR